MKDDNILLEGMQEVIDELKPDSQYRKILESAINRYNQSPSDESNQDELWTSVIHKIDNGSYEIYDVIIAELKSQYTITKKQQPPDAIAELNKFGEFKITLLDKNIWDIRDKKLIEWWLIRDELAEHVDQGEPIDLQKVLTAFTDTLVRLDGIAKDHEK